MVFINFGQLKKGHFLWNSMKKSERWVKRTIDDKKAIKATRAKLKKEGWIKLE